jgi:hypothetical protein
MTSNSRTHSLFSQFIITIVLNISKSTSAKGSLDHQSLDQFVFVSLPDEAESHATPTVSTFVLLSCL